MTNERTETQEHEQENRVAAFVADLADLLAKHDAAMTVLVDYHTNALYSPGGVVVSFSTNDPKRPYAWMDGQKICDGTTITPRKLKEYTK